MDSCLYYGAASKTHSIELLRGFTVHWKDDGVERLCRRLDSMGERASGWPQPNPTNPTRGQGGVRGWVSQVVIITKIIMLRRWGRGRADATGPTAAATARWGWATLVLRFCRGCPSRGWREKRGEEEAPPLSSFPPSSPRWSHGKDSPRAPPRRQIILAATMMIINNTTTRDDVHRWIFDLDVLTGFDSIDHQYQHIPK